MAVLFLYFRVFFPLIIEWPQYKIGHLSPRGMTMSVRLDAQSSFSRTTFHNTLAALVFVCLLFGGQAAVAQTFSTLYNFTGGADGGFPYAGVTLDPRGNLYGIATLGGNTSCYYGGESGCGTVFKLSHVGGSWTFGLLYSFAGGDDGWQPYAAVTIGPDGTLYGTTYLGGGTGCQQEGCGTVFQLRPGANFCRSVLCPWTETQIYQFTNGLDGGNPLAGVTFDANGNMYGTTIRAENNQDFGSVYELSPSSHGWILTALYDFSDFDQAGSPQGGVLFDQHGNLWGTTYLGGADDCLDPQEPEPCGVLFELTPSGSGWNYRTAYEFEASVGGGPTGTLINDQSGNLYGTLDENGANGNGGVYQFNLSSGVRMLYGVSGNPEANYGPQGGVVMDQAGNLYGVDPYNGAYNEGFVFKLSPSNGGWTSTDLHDFTGGNDGAAPYCTLVVDANGNIYGTTAYGGTHNRGTVFEITP